MNAIECLDKDFVMTFSDTMASVHRSAGHRKADDERQPLWLFGNAVVIAAVIAWFAVILPVFRPVALFAMEETYYFVLRQLSSVQDFVGYAVSLY